ncbi:unnamed protein product [Knipowitschia caucasica]
MLVNDIVFPNLEPGEDLTQNEFYRRPKTSAWRSAQGSPLDRRIEWQHIRGRYRCVQCGHTVSNREEMAAHSALHSSSLDPEEESTSAQSSPNC